VNIWYDGVIWTRQALGGVNRYFAKVIDGLPGDIAPTLTLEQRRDVNFPTNPRLRVLPCARQGEGAISWVDCDVFHPTYFETLSGVDIRRAKAPVVVTVYDALHELYPDLADPGGEQRAWKKAVIPAADHVICISGNTRRDVLEIFGVPEERVSVIHLASDLAPPPPDAAPPLEGPYFLYVGHRYCYKNVPRLLEAFARLRRRWPEARLCFTGTAFNDAERGRIASLGLAGAVVHAGRVSDERLAVLYAHAAALVYPSLYEGFGLPLLEAMRCGCPVAASNTSSVPEVAGDAALYFDPLDTEAMVQAMERTLADTAVRAALVARGRLRAGAFSWEKTVAETVAVYRMLAPTHG